MLRCKSRTVVLDDFVAHLLRVLFAHGIDLVHMFLHHFFAGISVEGQASRVDIEYFTGFGFQQKHDRFVVVEHGFQACQ
ncbi:hypothetical protein SDC9_142859 [bioreactor metagenome]|uniref:Uncharacterized protein n=1 Tax=bioreactor metagenome TaxID=1076179 RepID=A0A645E1Q0_9ZZZZ